MRDIPNKEKLWRHRTNDAEMYLNDLEKQEQTKVEINRRNAIIKVREQMNTTELKA